MIAEVATSHSRQYVDQLMHNCYLVYVSVQLEPLYRRLPSICELPLICSDAVSLIQLLRMCMTIGLLRQITGLLSADL